MKHQALLLLFVAALLMWGCKTDDDDFSDDDDVADDDDVDCSDQACPRGQTGDGSGACAPFAVNGIREKAVTFDGGNGDLVLEGTLTLPDSPDGCSYPGVVLVHGSGPNSRDEVSNGQLNMQFGKEIKVFEEIAEALTLEGFAVLRYDKRTCFQGNGCNNDYPTPAADVSYWAFVDDAEAAVGYMTTRGDVRPTDITPMGHSQGGQVVPYLARDLGAVQDVALLAGPYGAIDALWAHQAAWSREMMEQMGYEQQDIDAALADMDQTTDDLAALRAGTFQGTHISGIPVAFWQGWMDAGDETPGIVANLDAGVLVLQGDYDWNVPPTEAEAFAADLAGHPDAEVTILPELTHPFVRISEPDWTQITGPDIGDEVDPAAIDAIVDWLYR